MGFNPDALLDTTQIESGNNPTHQLTSYQMWAYQNGHLIGILATITALVLLIVGAMIVHTWLNHEPRTQVTSSTTRPATVGALPATA